MKILKTVKRNLKFLVSFGDEFEALRIENKEGVAYLERENRELE